MVLRGLGIGDVELNGGTGRRVHHVEGLPEATLPLVGMGL